MRLSLRVGTVRNRSFPASGRPAADKRHRPHHLPATTASAIRAPQADMGQSRGRRRTTRRRPVALNAKRIYDNPSPEELRAFTEQMPQCRITEFGNVNVQTRVTSRSTASTFVVTDSPDLTDQQTMTRADYQALVKLQDEYIAEQEMVVVDGFIGNADDFRTGARLTIEKAGANIAGMQQKLYYERTDGAGGGWEPEAQVIYTPNLAA